MLLDSRICFLNSCKNLQVFFGLFSRTSLVRYGTRSCRPMCEMEHVAAAQPFFAVHNVIES